MRTEISGEGLLYPKLDLTEVDVTSEDDGRVFRHNGNSEINIEGGEKTSEPGLYTWDQEKSTFIPSGRYASLLNGFSESHFAKQADHNTLRDDHDILRQDHDDLRLDHDGLQDDHNILRDDHNQLEIDHDGLRTDHDDLRTEYDSHETNTNNPHQVTTGQIDAVPVSEKGATGGVAELDADRKVPDSQLPAIAIGETFVVADETERLNLDAEKGDIAIQQDESQSYILKGDDPSNDEDWEELQTPESPVQSVFGRTGDILAESGDYHINQVDDSVHIDDFNNLEIDVGNIDDRVTVNEGEIDDLWLDTDANTSDISDLEFDLGNLEDDHNTLRTDFDNHEADLNNPHNVTTEQTGGITSPDVNNIHVSSEEPTDPDEYDIWIRTE